MYTTVRHYRHVGKICANKMSRASKRNGERKRMNCEELHVNWQTKPPLAGLRPAGMGKAKASRQSEGIRERKTGGSLHDNEDGTVASPGS